jgi:hypothetical protein
MILYRGGQNKESSRCSFQNIGKLLRLFSVAWSHKC